MRPGQAYAQTKVRRKEHLNQPIDTSEPLEYRKREAGFRDALDILCGKVLKEVLLQIVEPELNLVALLFDDSTYCVQGQLGGELLNLVPKSNLPTELGPSAWYEPFQAADRFAGKTISQARAIGEAWNGHGLEISFDDHPCETLIIQSIYSVPTPGGFTDCLRICVAEYTYERSSTPS